METLEQEFLSAFESHADAIFRYCYVRLGERERAKDATQETFCRTWAWLASGKRAQNLRALLYRTAHNLTVDAYRRGRDESLERLVQQGMDAPDTSLPDPHTEIQARQALALARRLDARYRDPLLMRYVDDLSVKDIAQAIGESENTVSVRLHRALKQLKDLIQPEL